MRGLPTDDAPKRSRTRLYAFAILLLLSIGGTGIFSQQGHIQVRSASRDFKRLPVSCPPQLEPLVPALAFNRSAVSTYQARLQGAIRIRTETFDDKPADGSGAPLLISPR
jgi:Gly-Xaa carboxypeptidase